MHETERIVRIFHESWDQRDPERGAAIIAENCQFEDVARGELLVGPDGEVVEGRDCYDSSGIARQLGLIDG